MIINTIEDAIAAQPSPERAAFLHNLLNDYVTFDDAVYPEDYDKSLQPGDDGYIAPIIRKEWNAGAAASWGFAGRAAVENAAGKMIDGVFHVRARDDQGRFLPDDPATPDVDEAWIPAETQP